jgi:hypothetical protein
VKELLWVYAIEMKDLLCERAPLGISYRDAVKELLRVYHIEMKYISVKSSSGHIIYRLKYISVKNSSGHIIYR